MTNKLYFDFINDMFNSDIAKRNGIDNTTKDPKILTRLMQLIWYFLNPVRIFLGVPIIVECAYRCPTLNEKVNGSPTGHPEGYCADIRVNGWTQEKLFYSIVELTRTGKIKEWDQIIWEKDTNCVHVSYRHNNNRKQIMIRTYSKTRGYVYSNI